MARKIELPTSLDDFSRRPQLSSSKEATKQLMMQANLIAEHPHTQWLIFCQDRFAKVKPTPKTAGHILIGYQRFSPVISLRAILLRRLELICRKLTHVVSGQISSNDY